MDMATDDLEALFDQISAETAAATAAAPAPVTVTSVTVTKGTDNPAEGDMFHRVGALTRQLHDALRELGLDKNVECAVSTLRGDAQSRLNYIAKLTGEAAEKALTAVENGQKEQDAIESGARDLAAKWDRVFANAASPDEFRDTAKATRAFLGDCGARAGRTNQELLAIMMAQDFHDLTGQVIQRIVKLAESLESNLVKMLIEATPADKRPTTHEGFLTGPAIDAEKRDDVVANQEQVDDLLASLGF